MLTHFSLFTGIGGLDLAAEKAGFKTVGQCEIAEYQSKVLEKHWPNVPRWRDIKDVNLESIKNREIGTITVISGGFPCQDISFAKTWTTNGEHAVDGIDGKRSGLWKEYKRIIGEVKPKYVVAENVKALTKKGLDVVLRDLAELGYDAEWCVTAAAYFGAPHRRERCFVVAYPIGFRRNKEGIFQSCFTGKEVRHSPKWELSRTICKANGKKTLPETFGIYDGIPRGVDDASRITSLGNAVVPQQAYPIFKTISDIESSIGRR